MNIYSGTCSNLVLLSSDSVLPSPGDSTLIRALNTSSGAIYYIQILKDPNCVKCGLPNATYNLAVTPIGVATSCTNPTPCDYVLNGNFESYTGPCPNSINANSPIPYPGSCWYSPYPSNATSVATPDYFNSCSNSSCTIPANCPGSPINAYTTIAVNSHTPGPGNAYAGIYAYQGGHPPIGYREYLQEQLNGTLVAGVNYTVSFWVQLANTSAFTVASLQAALHQGVAIQPSPFTAMVNVINPTGSGPAPSVPGNWVQISFAYTANGTEDHITIGNFNDDPNTLVGTGPGNQNYAYYYIDDVSVTAAINLTVSPGSATICSGCSKGPIVLTATSGGVPPLTYSWTPTTGLTPSSGIGPVVSACPAATTTYTATVTDALGCTQSATTTITVNPAPVVFITPVSANICIGNSVVLTAAGSPGNVYSWSPPTGLNVTTGATVVATPAVTTTYTVTATNSFGCTSIATVPVFVNTNVCCTPPTAVFNLSFLVSATAPFNSGVVNGGIYEIGPGVVMTVDNNLALINCVLRMDPGSQIQVLPNQTLYIQDHSHLYSCTNMWKGILLQNKGNLVVNTDSWIEDALIAVESTLRSNFTINTAIFNRNLVDIQVDPSALVAHPGTVQNTIFTCRAIPLVPIPSVGGSSGLKATLNSLPVANLKPPYTGNRTGVGMKINQVLSISVGVPSPGNENVFDNMDDGILSDQSSLTVKCNIFQFMQGNTLNSCLNCPIIGVAISANELVAPNPAHQVTIGGQLSGEPNTILDCARGIDVTGGFSTISVQNNTLVCSSTSPNTSFTNILGQMGIFINPKSTTSINVALNHITNFNTGIMQAQPTISNVGTMSYSHNTVTANPNGHCSTALELQSPSNNLLPLSFNVQSNQLTESNTCLNALNLKNFAMFVSFNGCDILYKLTGVQKGIALSGCTHITVNNNHVNCPPIITINPPAYASGGNLFNYGIHLQLSPVNLVQCNLVENVGRGMVFEGSCISSSYNSTTPTAGITQNTMKNSQDGFVLKTNGVIGPQGNSSLNIPSNNYWDLVLPSVFSRSQTFTEFTSTANTSSPLYNDGITIGSQATLPLGPTNLSAPPQQQYLAPPAPGSGLPFANAVLPVCSPVPPAAAPAGVDFKFAMKQMVLDSTAFPVVNSETHFIQKQHVFLILNQDTSLCQGDSCLMNFYTQGTSGNLGAFAKVDQDISLGLYSQAKILNNTIQPVNGIETNQKEFNKIFLKTLLHTNQPVTAPEMAQLNAIATQCPLSGGNAVYQARALINQINRDITDFTDNCDSLPVNPGRMAYYKTGKPRPQEEANTVKVYPNPNQGSMIFEYALDEGQNGRIRIFDLAGKELVAYSLLPGTSLLKVEGSELSEGSYIYHFEVNGSPVKAGKLLIIK